MKKALKKQIKQDEFVTGFERARSWASSHSEEVRATVIGVVVLAAVLWGLMYFRTDRKRSAAQAFSEALLLYESPVTTDQSRETAAPVFTTSEEKFTQALAAFDGIVERYGSLKEGRRARYFAALCRVELNRLDEARKLLDEIAKGESFDAGLARLEMAEIDRRQGKTEHAVESYRKLLEDPDDTLPKDYVLMRLASTLEEAGRTGEAAATYRRVTQDHPLSVYSSEAERRSRFLDAGSPS